MNKDIDVYIRHDNIEIKDRAPEGYKHLWVIVPVAMVGAYGVIWVSTNIAAPYIVRFVNFLQEIFK